MEKIIKQVRSYLKKRRVHRARLREYQVYMEAKRRVQIKEFDGEVCICLDNVPICKADDDTWSEELDQSRITFYKYLLKAK